MPTLINHHEYFNRLLEAAGRENSSTFSLPRDGDVYCPERSFLEGDFVRRLDDITKPYSAESNDCDDFVIEAQSLMNRTTNHYVQRHPSIKKAGNSLGYAEGYIDPNFPINGVTGWHAWCIVLTAEGDVLYMEPQPVQDKETRFNEVSQLVQDRIWLPRYHRP